MSKGIKKEPPKKLNRLLEVLKTKGVSQYQLHKDSTISYSLINDYCLNKRQPGLKQLWVIAKELDVDGKELINF